MEDRGLAEITQKRVELLTYATPPSVMQVVLDLVNNSEYKATESATR
jgi:hypothetical protein